ncbi:MAG: glycosyltransferase family 4 protein [Deltaproteobacteria bacterium]|nr:glycosyltransferase family 4 protein [Deltaproteobacteria bacterium]
MRVCCITRTVNTGGAGKSLQILLNRMPESVEPIILTRSKSYVYRRLHKRIRYVTTSSGFYPFHYLGETRDPLWLNYLAWIGRSAFVFKAVCLIRRLSPDIVVLNGFQALWYAPFLSEKVKVVLYAREILNMSKRDSVFAVKNIDRYVDHVICITENHRDHLHGIKCPRSIVYNADETVLSEPLPKKTLSSENKNEVNVGVFGTIHHVKGQFLILDLVGKYREKVEALKIKFFIFGGNSGLTTRHDGREQLMRRVVKNGWQEFIKFPGWVNDASTAMQRMNFILRTDIVGCPWGRDVIEAMSNGRAVVAPGESQVFIKPGLTGFLFPPGDVEKMAEVIFDLASKPEKCTRLGKSAYLFAQENFDPKRNALKVFDILRNF